MALGEKVTSLENLIQFTNGGLTVATFYQVKEALVARYKEIYGSDIDLSTASADGVFVMNMALIISNILQAVNYLYGSLDINQATGQYLDRLCALANVYRKSATKSTATITVTNTGTSELSVSSGTQFIDQNGNTWSYSGTSVTLASGSSANIVVSCDTSGPISAAAGWIVSPVEAISLSVAQSEAATIGSASETDAALRARKNETSGNYGATVLEVMKGALLNISGIEDVYVFNNATGSAQTMDDGIGVANHDVYVAIRKSSDANISDSAIGELIFKKMTPGIKTADATGATFGTAKEYLYVDSSLTESQAQTFDMYARWKECSPLKGKFRMLLNITENFTQGETGTASLIRDALTEYMNGELRINEMPTAMDVASVISGADPKYRGRSTFTVDALAYYDPNDSSTAIWLVRTGGIMVSSTAVPNYVSYFGITDDLSVELSSWDPDTKTGTYTVTIGAL